MASLLTGIVECQGADVEAYNACFNEIYYQTHTPKTSFSQQMIYDAKITYQNTKTDHNGDTLIAYSLAYKLWQNDGSVRRDVGSQAIVPLYVVLRVDSEGTIQIETMVSVRY